MPTKYKYIYVVSYTRSDAHATEKRAGLQSENMEEFFDKDPVSETNTVCIKKWRVFLFSLH
jgi:hypothetical protein